MDSDQAMAMLSTLWHFYWAVPFGVALPDVQFDQLGIPPCFVHTLLGDKIWHALWGERHPNITGQHWVPRSALGLLKFVLDKVEAQVTQSTEQLDAAKARVAAARQEAARRFARGCPY